GLALAAAIQADKLAPGMRVLLLSSERLAAENEQRRMAGAAYQLIKPPRAGDLWECLLGAQVAHVSAPDPHDLLAPAAPDAGTAGGVRIRLTRRSSRPGAHHPDSSCRWPCASAPGAQCSCNVPAPGRAGSGTSVAGR